MKATIFPSVCKGSVQVPSSKSIGHRAIIAASLANGTSIISNVNDSMDIQATIHAMRLLGADIVQENTTLTITGISHFQEINLPVDCNESGSTLRFLIPLFAMAQKHVTFTGKGRLLERPQNVYAQLFHSQNLSFQQNNKQIEINGALQADHYELAGDVSSQFISGLLFMLPLLQQDSTITIQEPFESASYVQLTIDVLATFGIQINWINSNTLSIPGNQQYHSTNYTVESDYSQAAFFAVLGALHGTITIDNLNFTSHQGDRKILDILKQYQVQLTLQEDRLYIHSDTLEACEIDLADCPDLGPILMVLASFAKGTTHIYHAKRLRYKESDRIAAMESELRKLGVFITSNEDEIWITGQSSYNGDCKFDAHNDHRIVMSMAVASSRCKHACTIIHAEAINKSYPKFFDDFSSVNGKVVIES